MSHFPEMKNFNTHEEFCLKFMREDENWTPETGKVITCPEGPCSICKELWEGRV